MFPLAAARAIDHYVDLRVKAAESADMADIDPRLETIVEKMVERQAILACLSAVHVGCCKPPPPLPLPDRIKFMNHLPYA